MIYQCRMFYSNGKIIFRTVVWIHPTREYEHLWLFVVQIKSLAKSTTISSYSVDSCKEMITKWITDSKNKIF